MSQYPTTPQEIADLLAGEPDATFVRVRYKDDLLIALRDDAGSAFGATGCLRCGRWTSPKPKPEAWVRPLLWCDEHRHETDVPLRRT